MLSKIVFMSLVIFQLGHCIWVIMPPTPPQPDEVAKMARYIMAKSDWVSVATISTMNGIKGYPFVSLKSVSDGPTYNSTGVPYLYMTKMDVSGQDISVDNNVTIMASLAETDYCKQKSFDPQDPRCAKLIITGKMVGVDNSTSEYNFAQDALFSKHPSMIWWPKNHNFYVAKVNIEQIAVLDFFGGIKFVTVEEYFNAFNSSITEDDVEFNNTEVIIVTV